MTTRVSIRAGALAFALSLATAVSAQSTDTAAKPSGGKPLGFLTDTVKRYGLVPHRFTIGIGGFLPNISSNGHFSSPSVPGTEINLEDVLGLTPTVQSLDLLATVRLGKKQLLTLGYFGIRRSATKTLEDTVIFGGNEYDLGTTVDVSTQMEYYGLTYRYYFWRYTRWELGAGLGLDALNIKGSLGLRYAVSGGGGGFADSATKSGGFTAPAPMLGIYGDWEFQPRFYLRGQVQYLYVNSVESYGGSVSDDRLAVEWFPLHNYGLGVMYHYVAFKVRKDLSNGGEIEYQYTIQGPAFYLTAAF